ncbi:MAG: hypothetical protein U9N31_02295 [Candidatus Marinimicrobia bacterium]|nr:hypothetical protein [Candidatus Neomarinimicrobiota bacterium]
MNKKNHHIIPLIIAFSFTLPLLAQEHPTEHPKKKQKKEHPVEHPDSKKAAVINKNNLAKGIKHYIRSQSGEDKLFVVEDEHSGQTLKLKLMKVHRERLSNVGNDTYFACADFKAEDGKVYDLDVFMTGENAEELSFQKFHVHKEEGVERYNWAEKDGVWQQVSLKKPQPK